jgi:nucleoside-diphosphate-sugar epimerase
LTIQENWDDASIAVVETKGRDAPPFIKYAASKTLGEKAAWKWMEEEKPSFDLVTILPGFIWGVSTFFEHLAYQLKIGFKCTFSKLSMKPHPTSKDLIHVS